MAVTRSLKVERSPDKSKHRKFKSLYKPRPSPLDFETLIAEKHPFRGFFVLFWVAIGFRILITSYQHYKNTESFVSLNLAFLMGKDSMSMIKADILMIMSLFYTVFFQWGISMGIIPLLLARPLQHVVQALWFLFILGWVFAQNWTWSAVGTITLHSIAMLMKQHSYTSYNIQLHHKSRRILELERDMKRNDATLSDADVEELHDLKAELSTGSAGFPKNQTIANFLDYLIVPSLVYELEFPRTSRFRLWYFLERIAATVITIGLLYFIVEHQVYRIYCLIVAVLLRMPEQSFIDSLADLLIPFITCWIITFFIIFEGICNAFAELSCFSDREFYADWWNSATYEEFARLWNKPVHHFLLRHVYKESMENLSISKVDATLLTFFVSSLMHELVFFMIGRKLRPFLFLMQMSQLPLIYLSKLSIFKGKPIAGNIFFWFGICKQ